MTKNEQIIIDNIDKIFLQEIHLHRGWSGGFCYFYSNCKLEFSHNVASRLYNKGIIKIDKLISGDSVMNGKFTSV